MLSRQPCLSSGVTRRSFEGTREKIQFQRLLTDAPLQLPDLLLQVPYPSVARILTRARVTRLLSPLSLLASTCTTVAVLPRVLSPEPSRSGTSSSVLKPVAGTLPANGPIFVSVLRTSRSPFAEECPNSDCLNLGAQSSNVVAQKRHVREIRLQAERIRTRRRPCRTSCNTLHMPSG